MRAVTQGDNASGHRRSTGKGSAPVKAAGLDQLSLDGSTERLPPRASPVEHQASGERLIPIVISEQTGAPRMLTCTVE